jgi:hypothetical protein
LSDFAELRWTHDCELLLAVYDTSAAPARSLSLTIRCPPDLGLAAWEGRDVRIVFVDVLWMRHEVMNVAGPESINFIDRGAPADGWGGIKDEVPLPAAALEWTVCFHSGGLLGIACRDVRIEVLA